MKEKNNVLVLGLGNLLMGDEGVGCHAVKHLASMNKFKEVDFLDGGTGGFHLMEYFTLYEHVILIDATLDNLEEGTVRVFRPKASKDFPGTLSTHEIGLKDLITSLTLTEQLPDLYLIAVSVKDYAELRIEMSDRIAHSMADIEQELSRVLDHIGTIQKC